LQFDAVIITKDEDFATRRALSRSGPVIVWVRIGNCSNRALLAWFMPMSEQVLRRIEAGESIIEVI
jgi:predicted nuclease of predicted toxin-antitoxin system